MRQVHEESFATAQCTVESTYQVVKEIVFDYEYEPLEEIEEKVQESCEVKEAYETIDSSSSIELIYTSVIDACVPFPQSSSYILFELEPREMSLHPNHHSKKSFANFKCQRFPYQVNLEDYHDQDAYVVMHVIYYGRKPLFDKHFFYPFFLFLTCFPFLFFFSFCFILLFLVT